MEFFKKETNIDFMRIRKFSAMVSIVVVSIALISLFTKGINWGLDFTGGIVVELQYQKAPQLDKIRQQLAKLNYADAIVQNFGSNRDIIIRLAPHNSQPQEQQLAKVLLHNLSFSNNVVQLKRIDVVGAQIGQEMTHKGLFAVLLAILLTMIYIAIRFEYRFAVSSAVALAHDPILILGIFSFWQIEFDLTSLAAILAVLGYSLNDTIVVFDRIKENFLRMRRQGAVEVVNASINQTLSRTIMTSGLTLLVVVALLFLGGATLFGFSLAFFIGILVGTYSSIYVAGALSIALGLKRADLISTPSKITRENEGILP